MQCTDGNISRFCFFKYNNRFFYINRRCQWVYDNLHGRTVGVSKRLSLWLQNQINASDIPTPWTTTARTPFTYTHTARHIDPNLGFRIVLKSLVDQWKRGDELLKVFATLFNLTEHILFKNTNIVCESAVAYLTILSICTIFNGIKYMRSSEPSFWINEYLTSYIFLLNFLILLSNVYGK